MKALVITVLILFLVTPVYCMEKSVDLPAAEKFPKTPLKSIINQRYSCRNFLKKSLNAEDLSFILWCAYGKRLDAVTGATPKTIPSAGAIYPLNIYVLIAQDGVAGIASGLYQYADNHTLVLKDNNPQIPTLLMAACLGQSFVGAAPVNIIISADYSKMRWRYGGRAQRYTDIEVGHACQNIYLAVYELNLGTVEVGAFSDAQVQKILKLKNETPLAIMSIGYPRP